MMNHPRHHLTPRDCDILRLVAFGNTNQEIADKLHLSIHSVKVYQARWSGGLTRASCVALALHIGLVRLDELMVVVNTRRTDENAWLFKRMALGESVLKRILRGDMNTIPVPLQPNDYVAVCDHCIVEDRVSIPADVTWTHGGSASNSKGKFREFAYCVACSACLAKGRDQLDCHSTRFVDGKLITDWKWRYVEESRRRPQTGTAVSSSTSDQK